MLARAIGVGQAVFLGVLARQKRDDMRAGHVRAEIRDEMSKIVFLPQPDGAVRQEHELAFPRQVPDRVIRVNPCVHARRRCELGARRPEFRRNDGGP